MGIPSCVSFSGLSLGKWYFSTFLFVPCLQEKCCSSKPCHLKRIWAVSVILVIWGMHPSEKKAVLNVRSSSGVGSSAPCPAVRAAERCEQMELADHTVDGGCRQGGAGLQLDLTRGCVLPGRYRLLQGNVLLFGAC